MPEARLKKTRDAYAESYPQMLVRELGEAEAHGSRLTWKLLRNAPMVVAGVSRNPDDDGPVVAPI